MVTQCQVVVQATDPTVLGGTSPFVITCIASIGAGHAAGGESGVVLCGVKKA